MAKKQVQSSKKLTSFQDADTWARPMRAHLVPGQGESSFPFGKQTVFHLNGTISKKKRSTGLKWRCLHVSEYLHDSRRRARLGVRPERLDDVREVLRVYRRVEAHHDWLREKLAAVEERLSPMKVEGTELLFLLNERWYKLCAVKEQWRGSGLRWSWSALPKTVGSSLEELAKEGRKHSALALQFVQHVERVQRWWVVHHRVRSVLEASLLRRIPEGVYNRDFSAWEGHKAARVLVDDTCFLFVRQVKSASTAGWEFSMFPASELEQHIFELTLEAT